MEEKPKLPLSIAFAYPYGNGFDPEWVESYTGLLLYEVQKPKEERVLGSILKAGSVYVQDNRSRICLDFVNKSQDDWVLMIDPDISFKHTILEDFKKLIEANPEADVISGRVNLFNGLPVFYRVDRERFANIHQPFPFKGLKQFDLVGTGIICISRRGLIKLHQYLKHPHFFCERILPSGLSVKDDFGFCVNCYDAGIPLYGAWEIFGQHWRDGVFAPQNYLEDEQMMIRVK